MTGNLQKRRGGFGKMSQNKWKNRCFVLLKTGNLCYFQVGAHSCRNLSACIYALALYTMLLITIYPPLPYRRLLPTSPRSLVHPGHVYKALDMAPIPPPQRVHSFVVRSSIKLQLPFSIVWFQAGSFNSVNFCEPPRGILTLDEDVIISKNGDVSGAVWLVIQGGGQRWKLSSEAPGEIKRWEEVQHVMWYWYLLKNLASSRANSSMSSTFPIADIAHNLTFASRMP